MFSALRRLRAWFHPICLLIRLYWFSKRKGVLSTRSCLFRPSCSHAVFQACVEGGFLLAFARLTQRLAICNDDHRLIREHGRPTGLLVATGRVVPLDELSDRLRARIPDLNPPKELPTSGGEDEPLLMSP